MCPFPSKISSDSGYSFHFHLAENAVGVCESLRKFAFYKGKNAPGKQFKEAIISP